MNDTRYELKTKYMIYQRNDDGLLKHPLTDYGYGRTRFNVYGYSSLETAQDAIIGTGQPMAEYIILPVYSMELAYD